MLVNRQLRGASLWRIGIILPMTVAPVVVGVMWRLIYASDIGIADPVMGLFGIHDVHVLGSETTAFLGVVLLDVWEWTPLMFLILLAGLQSLPQEPLEAAVIDGAIAIRLFFDHVLPRMRTVLLVEVVLHHRRHRHLRPDLRLDARRTQAFCGSSASMRITRRFCSPSTGRRWYGRDPSGHRARPGCDRNPPIRLGPGTR
jgi:hypothetical protein